MTDQEIIKSYKNAVNPKEQVNILCQLILKPREEIVRILEEGGCKVEPVKSNPVRFRLKLWRRYAKCEKTVLPSRKSSGKLAVVSVQSPNTSEQQTPRLSLLLMQSRNGFLLLPAPWNAR